MKPLTEGDDTLFDADEVMEYLGITLPMLKRMVRDGFIPAGLRMGKTTRSAFWRWKHLREIAAGPGAPTAPAAPREVVSFDGVVLLDEAKLTRMLNLVPGDVADAVEMGHLPKPIRIGKEKVWRVTEVMDFLDRAERWRDGRNPYSLLRPDGEAVIDRAVVPSALADFAEDLHEYTPRVSPVVYFLVKGGEIVYIGSSVNLAQRIGQHKEKDFDRILYLRIETVERMLAVEFELIRRFTPPLNLVGNPMSDRPRRKGPQCSGPSPDQNGTG